MLRHNQPRYRRIDESHEEFYNPEIAGQQITSIPLQAVDTSHISRGTATDSLLAPSNETSVDCIPKTPSQALLDKPLPRTPRIWRTGWRFLLICGIGYTSFVFLCNLILLVWSSLQPRSRNQNSLIFSGDCGTMRSIDLGSHLVINILSTLLLSASNYSLQVLVAPTRTDIDAAHTRHRIVDVAVPSTANWKFMNWQKRLLYGTLLLAGSILHLFYNSVIISTDMSIEYRATTVSSDFSLNNPTVSPWNEFIPQNDTMYLFGNTNGSAFSFSAPMNKTLLLDIWHEVNGSSLTNIDENECYNILSAPYTSAYSDIVIVTKFDSSAYDVDQSLLDFSIPTSIDPLQWLVLGQKCISQGCEEGSSIPFQLWNSSTINNPDQWNVTNSKILSCWTKEGERQCTIELIPRLLGMVIVCNAIIGAAVLFLLFSNPDLEPLLVLGDVISSFLSDPDQHTLGQAGVSARETRSNVVLNRSNPSARQGDPTDRQATKQRYFSGIPGFRLMACLHLLLHYWVFGFIYWLFGFLGGISTLAQQWQSGFGGTVIDGLYFQPQLSNDAIDSVIVNAMIANIPQLLLSSMYFAYNGVLSCICVSAEWAGYAGKKARGLRVTNPVGQQRSTYWLSLPFKYSIPLMIVFGLSHWLLSQSIYIVRIDFCTPDGAISDNAINGIGWSPLVLTVVLVVMIFLLLALLALGFRRSPPGIHIVSSNSWAISANCHASRPGESTKKLRYGVVADLGEGRYHVGFSSGRVRALKEGEHYQ